MKNNWSEKIAYVSQNLDLITSRSDSTDLCRYMYEEGSDKSKLSKNWHNYTLVYYELFNDMKENITSLFEVGMGTNNVNIPSSMGISGKPGASLRGWSRFFPNANIFGADIDKDIVSGPYDTDRIHTHWVDQTNPQAIADMWSKESMPTKYDIMIDDGWHVAHANLIFFKNSLHKLDKNGIYIIEDILSGSNEAFLISNLENICSVNKLGFTILDIPNIPNKADNRIAIVYSDL